MTEAVSLHGRSEALLLGPAVDRLPASAAESISTDHGLGRHGFVTALAAVPWQASQINRVCAAGATKRVNRPLIYVIARTAHLTQFTFILDYWLGHRR